MDYKSCERSLLETAAREASNGQLSVQTFVEPDGVVVSDGRDTIRVSKGKEEATAFVEVEGKAFHVKTTGGSRLVSVEMFIRDLGQTYNGGLFSAAKALR